MTFIFAYFSLFPVEKILKVCSNLQVQGHLFAVILQMAIQNEMKTNDLIDLLYITFPQ